MSSGLSSSLKAGGMALLLSLLLILLKSWAWVAEGSTSLLASLLDSAMDFGVSFLNFLAIRYAMLPADTNHRFGHGKIEGVAALFQGTFIAGAGFFLLLQAADKLAHPSPVPSTELSLTVMGISLGLSAALVLYQNHCLKQTPSLAVEADQAHYSADILSNSLVILSLALTHFGAPAWLDSFIALILVCWFAWTARTVVQKGLDMVLDRELPEAQRHAILHTITHHKEVHGVHDLRTRQSGTRKLISFDIEMDPELTLAQAHETTKTLQEQLLLIFPQAEIMIHVDPVGDIADSRHAY